VTATRSLPDARLHALQPWDLPELKRFQPAYLVGYKAQRYQVELKEGFKQAKRMMAGIIANDVRQDIGGDEQRIHQVATAYSAITFKQLFLPVWVSAYRLNGKIYQVLVNARTAEVQGDRPYSFSKIAVFVLFLILALFITLHFTNK
jgi:hypothetical protein